MSETKTTLANVRIMISHNYSNFEVAMQLENPEGIKPEEINAARMQCQELASTAVNEYKVSGMPSQKDAVKKVENMVTGLKKEFGLDKPKEEAPQPTPEEIAEVESLPLYQPKKEITGRAANKLVPAKNKNK